MTFATKPQSSVLIRSHRELNATPIGTGVRFDVRPAIRKPEAPDWGAYNGKVDNTDVHSFVQREYSKGPNGPILENQCPQTAIRYWHGTVALDFTRSKQITHEPGTDSYSEFDRMLEEIGR